ncbi:MAG: TIGR00269 family protein [Nitrososphaeria archaeon]
MQCSFCHETAIYYRAYSGKYFCIKCFKESIEEKVIKTISKYSMLNYGEKILLMVSGGKDSIAMLRILSKITKPHASEIVVATIDEGISEYREDALEIVKNVCNELDIPHYIFKFKDLFGYTIDEISNLKRGISACSICGIFRRRAMDLIAQKLNIKIVATAHNLDDIIQTFLINLLNNDLKRLKWNLPVHYETSIFPQRRIKPLSEIYEEELALYSFLNNERFQKMACPYMHEGIRSQIREILNKLEKEHPGIKYSLFHSAIGISKSITFPKKERKKCKICGIPSFSEKCSLCTILHELNENKNNQVKI